MFYSTRQRMFCKPSKSNKIPTKFSSVSVPIFIPGANGKYIRFNGKIGSDGLIIESTSSVPIGSKVPVRVLLIGSGLVLEILGTVVRVNTNKDFFEIICKIKPSAEVSRAINTWIGIQTTAAKTFGVA